MNAFTRQEELLHCNDVSLSLNKKKILSNIGFRVRNIVRPGMKQGQVISLIGRSGAGKSQLLRILAGLTTPNTGSVIIHGDRSVRAGMMGMVSQHYYLFGWRTVRQSLIMSAAPAEKDRLQELCSEFGLDGVLDRYPAQLSGGQRQRVSILQQLMRGSDFLLMDEPFSGLDVCVLDRVTEMIFNIAAHEELKTIILVSHDIETSLALSDTAYVLAESQPGAGATLVKEVDLIERGLAWRRGVQDDPGFRETVREVKAAM